MTVFRFHGYLLGKPETVASTQTQALTLEAELMVFLTPEFLRPAVKRPQIRDAAMSPSRVE